MVLPIDVLFTPQSKDDALATILGVATDVGLPETSWASDAIGMGLCQIMAQTHADMDLFRVTLAKSGFLDYAAGFDVTPEGGPGWLDVLAQTGFGVTRQPATSATTTTYVLTKTSAGALTVNPGDIHVASSGTGSPTYTNTTGGNLAGGGGTLTITIVADQPGAESSASPGQITTFVVPIAGVTGTNPQALVGFDAEKNASVVLRCRAKLSSLSPDGPGGAYDYFARTIPLPNNAGGVQVVSGHRTTPINPVTRTRVVQDLSNGHVTTYVADAAGPYVVPDTYMGSTFEPITGVTNAAPAQITVTGHGYTTGDNVAIDGTGLAVLDGKTWQITVTGANTFTVPNATAPGATSSTGTAYRESDLDLIDKAIQANAVPNANTGITSNTTAHTIAVIYQLWIPAAVGKTAAQITTAVGAFLAAFFASLPIGGATAAIPNQVFVESIRGLIFSAVPGTTNVVLSTPSADVTIGVNEVPVLGAVTPTITLT